MQKRFSPASWRTATGMLFLFCSVAIPASAHVAVQELDKLSKTDAATLYLVLGFQHILPLGLDHIFFVMSLFLLSPKLKPIVLQSTAFTLAHSVTLCLAAYQVINPPSRIIEPLIAVSILYVAIENIYSPRLKTSRLGIVFAFGLIHGLGFAGALANMGLPKNAYFLSLIMFNIGVELGQLTIILAAYFLLAKWFAHKKWYRERIVVPLSFLIAVVAAIWTIQRIFFV